VAVALDFKAAAGDLLRGWLAPAKHASIFAYRGENAQLPCQILRWMQPRVATANMPALAAKSRAWAVGANAACPTLLELLA
jgi:hypothetical protein